MVSIVWERLGFTVLTVFIYSVNCRRRAALYIPSSYLSIANTGVCGPSKDRPRSRPGQEEGSEEPD